MVNHRAALEKLWKGLCTITVRQGSKNQINKRTEFTETIVYENQPCKLSFERITSTNENNNAVLVIQGAKLFIAPEINIPAGSKITVTQNNKTNVYEKSGEPAIFTNHQEVPLELFKRWA
jgi:hypothetical protein